MELSLWVSLGIVAAGIAVGVFSALFGVGGGLLMVPFMVLVLDQGQHLAEGTSLVVIVPTAIAGSWAHRKSGFVSLRAAAWLGAGGVGGAVLGGLAANQVDPDTLKRVFAVFVLVMGLRLAYQGFRERGRGSE